MLALLLRVEPDLPLEFGRRWADSEIEDEPPRPVIDTEVSTGTGKFIDLEIAFRGSAKRLIWIEIKRDLPGESSEDQVASYMDALSAKCQAEGGRGHVIYLPRPGVIDPAPGDRDLVTYTSTDWTEVGHWFESDWSDRPLVVDFISLLKEERLFVSRIDTKDIESLDRGGPQRIAMLIGDARDQIERRVQAESGLGLGKGKFEPKQASTWVMNWGGHNLSSFHLPKNLEKKGYPILLEWNLRNRREGPCDGEVVFAAGLTWYDRENPVWTELAPKLSATLEDAGKERFWEYEDDLLRLYRWLRPADLAEEPNFESQVKVLSDFVTDAFVDAVWALRGSEAA